MDTPSATTDDTHAAAAPDAAAPPPPQPVPRDLAGVIGYADQLAAQQRLHEAVQIYRNVLRQHPRLMGLHFNLGVALLRHERPHEAVAHFDTLLKAADSPDWLKLRARQALALALEQSGDAPAAAAEYRRLLADEPANFAVQRQLATLYRDLGLAERALDAYQRCHTLWPQHCGVALEIAQLQLALMAWGELPDAAAQEALATACLSPPPGVEPPAPHGLLQLAAGLGEARIGAVAQAHARFIEQAVGSPLPAITPAPRAGRRLRLAYATQDVHGPLGAWVRSVLRHHDRQRFELVLYTWGSDDGSAERDHSLLDAEHAIDVAGWSEPAIAKRLRLDAIDVLLDPGCAVRTSRPGLFARRAVPLQLAWLGDPLTAWSGWYDALLSDEAQHGLVHGAVHGNPEMARAPATQPTLITGPYPSPLVLLPGSARLLPEDVPSTVEPLSRVALGLPERAPVLALLAEPAAIDEAFFTMSLRLACVVPGSVLWLRDPGPRGRARLHDRAGQWARQQQPPQPWRTQNLAFLPTTPPHGLRSRLRHADLVLDTGRSEGGSMVLDALSAGVPTLTLCGAHTAHAIGASLLLAAGAPQAVSGDLATYEARARHLLQHPRDLLAWRRSLAAHHIAHPPRPTQQPPAPLWSPRPTVRALEAAIEQLWAQRWPK
jgi:predicted O-linked N-acetylglucosamine transferase (SPINDLY family)